MEGEDRMELLAEDTYSQSSGVQKVCVHMEGVSSIAFLKDKAGRGRDER